MLFFFFLDPVETSFHNVVVIKEDNISKKQYENYVLINVQNERPIDSEV